MITKAQVEVDEMTAHFNQLSEAEVERLALVIEECGEVIQAASKVLRHGYDLGHPEQATSNREDLAVEIGHLYFATGLLIRARDISRSRHVMPSNERKERTVQEWLHHDNILACNP